MLRGGTENYSWKKVILWFLNPTVHQTVHSFLLQQKRSLYLKSIINQPNQSSHHRLLFGKNKKHSAMENDVNIQETHAQRISKSSENVQLSHN